MKKQNIFAWMLAGALMVQPLSVLAEEDPISNESQKEQTVEVQTEQTQGKLAVVRVSKTDVYGIAGGKASLVGSYDQGQPAVPRDGVVWCDAGLNPLTANDRYSTPTSTTMTLTNISPDQDGQVFYLSVTNAAGTAYSAPVTLHVLDAGIESQSVYTGENVTLSVNLSGDWSKLYNITYQWYKEDMAIDGATASEYTISDADAEDAGSYSCLIKTGYSRRPDAYNSKTVSANVTVMDRELAASVSAWSENDEIHPGEYVYYTLNTSGAWGENISVQWFDQDGSPLENNDTYTGVNTPQLRVLASEALNGSGYYCVAACPYGSVQTDIQILTVTKPTEKAETSEDTKTEKETASKTNEVKTGARSFMVQWLALGGSGLAGLVSVLKRKQ